MPEDRTFPPLEEIAGNPGMAISVDGEATRSGLVEDKTDVDLRAFDTDIRNQGGTSLCTSFAAVAAVENIIKRKFQKDINLSERHLFSTYRTYNTEMAIKATEKSWIVDEKTWPFSRSRPVDDTRTHGTAHALTHSKAMNKISDIVAALRENTPVVIGIEITRPMLLQGGIINRFVGANAWGTPCSRWGCFLTRGFPRRVAAF